MVGGLLFILIQGRERHANTKISPRIPCLNPPCFRGLLTPENSLAFGRSFSFKCRKNANTKILKGGEGGQTKIFVLDFFGCLFHVCHFQKLSPSWVSDLHKKLHRTARSPEQRRRFQKRKISPKRKFSAGRPCRHPAKNFGQALQMLEKQALWHGHAARTSTKKLRSEKLRADFSFPMDLFKIITRIKWLFSKLFRSLQLQFSGPTGINFRYSYSFVGLTGTFLYSYCSVQLHKKMVSGIIFRKLQLQLHKKWFSN